MPSEADDYIEVETMGEGAKCCSTSKSPVVCGKCGKTIGDYEGVGQVTGICDPCYEALS